MAGVVILHAQEDGAPAHALAAKLRALGMETVTDTPPGPGLRRAIGDADAVVALWSPRSAARGDLVDEAAFARGLGLLIHARMQNTPAPGEFVSDPTIDLTGWRGEDAFSGWRNLRAAVEGVVQAGGPAFGEPMAPPPPRREPAPAYQEPPRREPAAYPDPPRREPAYEPPPSYAPSYEPPPHYAPRVENGGGGGSAMRLALIGIVTFLVVAGVGIGGYSFIQGGQSSANAETAWNALDKSDPRALREFLDGDNPGRFRRPAEIALEGLEVEAFRTAREADTVEALQGFVRDFPDSRHSTQVRGRIAELRQTEEQTDEIPLEPVAPDAVNSLDPGALAPDTAAPPDEPSLEGDGGPVPLTPNEEAAAPPELSRRFNGDDASLPDAESDAQPRR